MRRVLISRPALIALVLVLAGAAFRVATIGRQSFWLDEAFDVWVANEHTPEAIWTAHLDPNEPPLYFWMLHWFLRATGVSEATARMPSAISSIAGLGLVFLLGRRLFPGRPVGRVAAMLLAVSPLDVWYAQEARMHGLVGTCGLALALGLLAGRWWGSLLIVASLAGGLYLDHTMWPVAILLLSAWTLHWFRAGCPVRPFVRVAGSSVAAWALYWPIHAEAVELYRRLDTVASFANARNALGISTVTVLPFSVALLAWGVLWIAAGSVALAVARDPKRRRWAEHAVWVGFILGTVFGAVPRVYGVKQVLVAVWPLLTLVAAAAIVSIDRRSKDGPATGERPGAAFAATVVISVCAVAYTLFTPRADWRGVARFLEARAGGASLVLLEPDYMTFPFDYYDKQRTRRAGVVPFARPDDLEKLVAGSTLVWFVCEVRACDEEVGNLGWLAARGQGAGRADFSRLRVYRFDFPR